ncbi:hypothetical protein BerOc1_00511 [Pseudodesulfovibrio hydrargyri]|uniref:Uncharacterized protein n=1 Tax=Pseudodesulfovibrio hydrargyri TaxID=2125990 RepID=A0A1J5NFP2_9BACT|nr:hypothetical protein [Pseudodesulfovibrio hydrargyri]OIQ52039.1 hypothetical protein BerOc1_00511 [Pseudodesulfovibrio hydrargyri]
MRINKITIVLGFAAFVAAFFPMASRGMFTVGVEHLGGAANLLYLLPFGVIGLSCFTDRLPFRSFSVGLGLTGAAVTALAVWSAMQQLEFMTGGVFGGLARKALGPFDDPVLPGLGGGIAFASYVATIIAALLHNHPQIKQN